jgi:hypothetical protein
MVTLLFFGTSYMAGWILNEWKSRKPGQPQVLPGFSIKKNKHGKYMCCKYVTTILRKQQVKPWFLLLFASSLSLLLTFIF